MKLIHSITAYTKEKDRKVYGLKEVEKRAVEDGDIVFFKEKSPTRKKSKTYWRIVKLETGLRKDNRYIRRYYKIQIPPDEILQDIEAMVAVGHFFKEVLGSPDALVEIKQIE